MQCSDSEIYANITLVTVSHASGKSFSIISGESELYHSPSLENARVHIFEVCLPVLQDGEYTLELECSRENPWDDGDSIHIQNADGNLIFEKLMAATENENLAFSSNTPASKVASVIPSDHAKTLMKSPENEVPQGELEVTFKRTYGNEYADEESFLLYAGQMITETPLLEIIGSDEDNNMVKANTIHLSRDIHTILLDDIYGDGWSENSTLEVFVDGELFQTYRLEDSDLQIMFLDLSGNTEVPTTNTPADIPEVYLDVTFNRTYGVDYADEESFRLFDRDHFTGQPVLEVIGGERDNDTTITHTIRLLNSHYTIYLKDRSDDGWFEDSILEIFVDGELFQTYRLESGHKAFILLDLSRIKETPTMETPTTESPTTELPVLLCPSTSNLPISVLDSYFTTPCTHPYIGEMIWKCVEAEDHKHAIWSYVDGDSCRLPSPNTGRVFLDFTLQFNDKNTNWEIIREIILQAYENLFKPYSFVEITIWRIVETERRLQETSANLKYGVRVEITEEESSSAKETLENTAQLLSEMRAINSELISETAMVTIDGEITEIITDVIMEDDDFTCDKEGYIHYLDKWTETMKSTSRDENSIEFHTRLGYFIDNCELIQAWNQKKKYELSFTFYADWSEEEFEQITLSTQRYSGTKPLINDIGKYFNNTSWRHLMPSLDPCDDVYDDGSENNLRSVISKPQRCSVSWAFATTTSIEYAIEQLYQKEYGHAIKIALSAQELIDCVGIANGLERENACEAMPLTWAFEYIYTNGIAYRQFYHHTNTVGECKMVRDEEKYFISGYEKPSSYNKYGLFQMLERGPVAVSMGLNIRQFQHYSGLDHELENGMNYFNTAYWRPSIYGVIVEYKQYEEENTHEFIQSPYFVIESRLHACDELVYRIPISNNEENANIAGIAGYAIRPIVKEYINIHKI